MLQFLLGLALGIVAGAAIKSKGGSSEGKGKGARAGQDKGMEKMLAERSRLQEEKKRAAKDKILAVVREQGRITNDEAQAAAGVADATATNYLQELENEGLIKQVGETGKDVYYQPLSG